MNAPLDPDAARRALDDVAHRRHQVAVATRSPWWLYLAAFPLLTAVVAARDFDRFGYLTIVLGIVFMVVLVLAPKRFPSLAARLGRGALAHRSLLSASTRAVLIGVSWLAVLTAFIGSAYAVGAIEASGAPDWVRQHPWTVLAAAPAALITAVGWVLESWIAGRSARSAR
jgi:hypothetical protein